MVLGRHRWPVRELVGVVQGVGMRPRLVELASQLGVDLRVWNAGGAARIASPEVDRIIELLRADLPPLASIDHIRTLAPVDPLELGAAVVARSEAGGPPGALPPDTAPCAACESATLSERRLAEHPFLACLHCGPRYSVAESAPYDRERTSWLDHTMCKECLQAYGTVGGRRHHFQGINCPRCAPALAWWFDPQGADVPTSHGSMALRDAATALREGRPLLVKGVGGYRLWARPEDAELVRRIVERDQKPLALMAVDTDTISRWCVLRGDADATLQQPGRPLTLLPRRLHQATAPWADRIAPGLSRWAFMLPSSNLDRALLAYSGLDMAIVTSANLPGHPIARLRRHLPEWSKVGLLDHGLEIVRALDDSVVLPLGHLAPTAVRASHPIGRALRLGRGTVPQRLPLLDIDLEDETWFAIGADRLTSPAVARGPFVALGQHLASRATPALWPRLERHAQQVSDGHIDVVHVEAHEGSEVHPMGVRLAEQHDAQLVPVWHHAAHLGSVALEHGLDHAVGLALDGTGLGPDGTAWGGEALRVRADGSVDHVAGLMPAPVSELSIHRPALLTRDWFEALDIDAPQATVDAAGELERSEDFGRRGLGSGLGRLLDICAHLTLGVDQRTYAGEPAMRLDASWEIHDVASDDLGRLRTTRYHREDLVRWRTLNGVPRLDAGPGLENLARLSGRDRTSRLGAETSWQLIDAVVSELTATLLDEVGEGPKFVAAGGCVASPVLARRLAELDLLLPERIPANDGGLAAGQLWVGARASFL